MSGFIRNTITIDQVKELYVFIEQEPETYERLMNEPDLIALVEENINLLPNEIHSNADQRIREYLQAHAEGHGQDQENSGQAQGKIFSERRLVLLPIWRRRWEWVAAAAVLILGISTALIVYSGRRSSASRQDVVTQSLPADVKAPQTNRAIVRLANGQQVALDSLSKGLLARQGNVRLVKLDDGRIAYQPVSGGTIGEVQYNTLYNPRGSKVIDMALSDGSHIWLNAGSSVTYPVAFGGKERKVSINGEAYFEVSHDASQPFYVSKGNVAVEVLGTRFNVNAYDDEEELKVTLLQGSVKVLDSLSGVTLQPGQQADVRVAGMKGDESGSLMILNPDLEAVMAWKDGLFNFNKVSLKDVMRQLGRWYDVDVEYQGTVTTKTLGGEMQRDLNLSEVLDGLRDIGVHFRIEGKKLIVMP